jgi:hypothetical protein
VTRRHSRTRKRSLGGGVAVICPNSATATSSQKRSTLNAQPFWFVPCTGLAYDGLKETSMHSRDLVRLRFVGWPCTSPSCEKWDPGALTVQACSRCSSSVLQLADGTSEYIVRLPSPYLLPAPTCSHPQPYCFRNLPTLVLVLLVCSTTLNLSSSPLCCSLSPRRAHPGTQSGLILALIG